MATDDATRAAFTTFVRRVEPRLSFAFSAAYGRDLGYEATAEALVYAWEHWERVRDMDNAAGYLYRVGQTRVKRHRRSSAVYTPAASHADEVWVEPGLPAALSRLSEKQRIAVVLVHGFDWTQQEVAQVTGLSRSTIQKHVERGLSRLRAALEVPADA